MSESHIQIRIRRLHVNASNLILQRLVTELDVQIAGFHFHDVSVVIEIVVLVAVGLAACQHTHVVGIVLQAGVKLLKD